MNIQHFVIYNCIFGVGKWNRTRGIIRYFRPPSILKLNSSSNSSPGILRKKETSTPTQIVSSAIPVKQATKHFRKETSQISSGNYSTSNGLYDSVELSFIEKLAKAENSHKKDLEDLKAFELLEEAACDSSFCSSSSTVKRLIHHARFLQSRCEL